jgi:hypothetical protein
MVSSARELLIQLITCRAGSQQTRSLLAQWEDRLRAATPEERESLALSQKEITALIGAHGRAGQCRVALEVLLSLPGATGDRDSDIGVLRMLRPPPADPAAPPRLAAIVAGAFARTATRGVHAYAAAMRACYGLHEDMVDGYEACDVVLELLEMATAATGGDRRGAVHVGLPCAALQACGDAVPARWQRAVAILRAHQRAQYQQSQRARTQPQRRRTQNQAQRGSSLVPHAGGAFNLAARACLRAGRPSVAEQLLVGGGAADGSEGCSASEGASSALAAGQLDMVGVGTAMSAAMGACAVTASDAERGGQEAPLQERERLLPLQQQPAAGVAERAARALGYFTLLPWCHIAASDERLDGVGSGGMADRRAREQRAAVLALALSACNRIAVALATAATSPPLSMPWAVGVGRACATAGRHVVAHVSNGDAGSAVDGVASGATDGDGVGASPSSASLYLLTHLVGLTISLSSEARELGRTIKLDCEASVAHAMGKLAHALSVVRARLARETRADVAALEELAARVSLHASALLGAELIHPRIRISPNALCALLNAVGGPLARHHHHRTPPPPLLPVAFASEPARTAWRELLAFGSRRAPVFKGSNARCSGGSTPSFAAHASAIGSCLTLSAGSPHWLRCTASLGAAQLLAADDDRGVLVPTTGNALGEQAYLAQALPAARMNALYACAAAASGGLHCCGRSSCRQESGAVSRQGDASVPTGGGARHDPRSALRALFDASQGDAQGAWQSAMAITGQICEAATGQPGQPDVAVFSAAVAACNGGSLLSAARRAVLRQELGSAGREEHSTILRSTGAAWFATELSLRAAAALNVLICAAERDAAVVGADRSKDESQLEQRPAPAVSCALCAAVIRLCTCAATATSASHEMLPPGRSKRLAHACTTRLTEAAEAILAAMHGGSMLPATERASATIGAHARLLQLANLVFVRNGDLLHASAVPADLSPLVDALSTSPLFTLGTAPIFGTMRALAAAQAVSGTVAYAAAVEVEGEGVCAASAPPDVEAADSAHSAAEMTLDGFCVQPDARTTPAPWERAVQLLHAHTCAGVDDGVTVVGAISGSFFDQLDGVSNMGSDVSDLDAGLASLEFAEPAELYGHHDEQEDGMSSLGMLDGLGPDDDAANGECALHDGGQAGATLSVAGGQAFRLYGAAIAACEAAGRWKEACDILRAMEGEGIERPAEVFAAVIRACGRGGAAALSSEMPAEKLPAPGGAEAPVGVPGFSAAAEAAFVMSDQLWTEMEDLGVPRNARVLCDAICTAGRCGHWERGMALLHDACSRRVVKPDTACFNAALGGACLAFEQGQKRSTKDAPTAGPSTDATTGELARASPVTVGAKVEDAALSVLNLMKVNLRWLTAAPPSSALCCIA